MGDILTKYAGMLRMIKIQMDMESNFISNLSNISSIINEHIDDLNWVGFYLMNHDGILVLGPFQGRTACNRIELGEGVCGTAALTMQSQLVDDVHDFPGHISCDANSRSELVIPLIKDEVVYGVLDLDSPLEGRFTKLEQEYLEEAAWIIMSHMDWTLLD